MSGHLIAFYKAFGSAPTAQKLEVVVDGVLAAAGSASPTALFVPAGMQVVAAFAISAGSAGTNGFSRARIISPTFLNVAYPDIRPLDGSGSTPADDPNVANWLQRPLRYPDTDTIEIEVTDDSPTTPNLTALVWLEVDREPVPPGETFWVRYTSSTAAVANKWTALTIAMDQLPEGLYIVCGMEHVCTGCVGARLVFPGSPWRPGTLGQGSLANQTHRIFYDDSFGVWGRFPAYTPPTVEVLANAASTDHTGFLRVLRVGSASRPGGMTRTGS